MEHAIRPQEQFESLLGIPRPGLPPQWNGDRFRPGVTVKQVLSLAPRCRFSHEEEAELADFYMGFRHWKPELPGKRELRQLMTVNVIPAIVAELISNSRHAGEDVSEEMLRDLRLLLTARNINAQREYNYFMSIEAEKLARQIPNRFYFPKGANPCSQ